MSFENTVKSIPGDRLRGRCLRLESFALRFPPYVSYQPTDHSFFLSSSTDHLLGSWPELKFLKERARDNTARKRTPPTRIHPGGALRADAGRCSRLLPGSGCSGGNDVAAATQACPSAQSPAEQCDGIMTPIDAWAAIGGGGRQLRKGLLLQGLAVFPLIRLLLVVKHTVTAGEAASAHPLAWLPGGKTVTFGLYIGGMPTDPEFQGLAGPLRIEGVVNLGRVSSTFM